MQLTYLKPAAIAAALILTACSEAPKPAAEAKPVAEVKPAAPTEPVTAKTAFWEMHKMARTWAKDVSPLSLTSKELTGYKNEGGKAALWSAVFVSPGKKEARTLTYSIATVDSVHKGVEATNAVPWGGPNRDANTFQTAEFGIDSDAVFKKASEKGAAWLKEHPGKTVTMTLGNASRFPAPVWYVLWGDTKAGFNTWINAVTGEEAKAK